MALTNKVFRQIQKRFVPEVLLIFMLTHLQNELLNDPLDPHKKDINKPQLLVTNDYCLKC